jgi:nucleoside-diphosphate-sugar epimerase
MSKNVLITGIRGFVGSNLKEYLLKYDDYSITGSSRIKSSLFPIEDEIYRITSHDDIIHNNLSFNSYIHLSGKVFDLNDKSDEQEYYKVNYELTKQLFEHFIQDKSARKFIFISTIHVLTENPDRVLDEAYEPEPFTPYGKSKFKAEKYIAENCPPDKRYYILRPTMIHGPGNKGNLNLLYGMVKKGIPYPIGAVNNKRSFVSVDNLSFIIHEILKNEIESGLYHIADDEPTYTHDLIRMIADLTGNKALIWNVPLPLLKISA